MIGAKRLPPIQCSARGHEVVNKVIRIVSYLSQLWLCSVLAHLQGLDELSSVCLYIYSKADTEKYHNMCMCDLACHNSPQILQDMPQVEDWVMTIRHLNALSIRPLRSVTVQHVHWLLKGVVSKVSVTYASERYRNYTSCESGKCFW